METIHRWRCGLCGRTGENLDLEKAIEEEILHRHSHGGAPKIWASKE